MKSLSTGMATAPLLNFPFGYALNQRSGRQVLVLIALLLFTSNKSISFTFIFSYMALDSCHVGVVSSGLGEYYINTGYALAEELAANYWDVERKWSTVRSLGRTKHPTKLGFTGLGSG
jgi:hypothetical protein